MYSIFGISSASMYINACIHQADVLFYKHIKLERWIADCQIIRKSKNARHKHKILEIYSNTKLSYRNRESKLLLVDTIAPTPCFGPLKKPSANCKGNNPCVTKCY